MKRLRCVLAFLFICCAALCSADTWTSIRGETFEGEFIDYNPHTGTVSIKRSADGQIFAVPEDQLIHSNRIQAITLQNREVQIYWFSSYKAAKDTHPKKRILLFCLNGSDNEPFELFYNKLLRDKNFQRLLEDRGFIVCVLETIPEELASIRGRISMDPSEDKTIDELFVKTPIVLIESRSTRFPKDNPVKLCTSLIRSNAPVGTNPFSTEYTEAFIPAIMIHGFIKEYSLR